MSTQHRAKSKRRKWKATALSLCGVLWVLYSGFAYSSPYVCRSLWSAFHHGGVLMNVSLVLVSIAFYSWPLLLLCVWLGSARGACIVLIVWWAVVLLSQCGWIYLLVR